MDARAIDYFSTVNPLARKILDDQKTLQNAAGDNWNKLDWEQKEQMIDEFMVDICVRERYANIEKSKSYPSSFPNLKQDTGENIIVDFENDLWTWQDEHSSPFSWRTKSQQDLTLDDLEPEVLNKATVKSKKKSSESNQATTDTLAPREFSVDTGTSIWESPFLQGMKKPDFLNRSRSSSPDKSIASKESVASRPRSPEEINYAFTGSLDDLSSNPSTLETERSLSISSAEILGSPGDSERPKAPKRQSKSPVKSISSMSSKKSEKNTDLKNLVKTKALEEHAFDNPALGGNEWSSFVNDTGYETGTTTLSYGNPLSEPEPVLMDRGSNLDYTFKGDPLDEPDFKDEELVVEIESRQDDSQNISISTKTGFDFLDNW